MLKMNFRKVQIKASYIIAFNGINHVILRDGVVVTEGNEIIHVGKSYNGNVDETIDAQGKLVIPGFIDVHSHITQSPLSRGVNEDLPKSVVPGPGTITKNRWIADPFEVKTMAKSSLIEVLRSGVTTLVELGSPEWFGYKNAVDVIGQSGIRTYISAGYPTTFDRAHDDKELIFKQMDTAIENLRKFDKSYDNRVRFILYPRTADLCSPEVFSKTKEAAEELHAPIETHAAQSIEEYKYIKEKYGKTPIQYLHDIGVLKSNLIMAHCIFVSSHSLLGNKSDGSDLDLISKSGATIAHCPWVYAKQGRVLESYPKYLKLGINVGIGTDISPQDMLREMNLVSTISKIVEGDSTVGTAADVFNSATLSGAKALNRNDLGRIAVGAKADLVIINLKTIRMTPLRDPIKNLVFGATFKEVETVIIDGNKVVENGKIKGMDEAEVAEDLQKVGENYWRDIPRRDQKGRTLNEIAPLSFQEWKK
jgi:cytosine/adenosine deaminase-related metal-dependent hydrolase